MYRLTIFPAIEEDPALIIQQEFNLKEEMHAARNLLEKTLNSLQTSWAINSALEHLIIEEMWCADDNCYTGFI